MRYLVPVLALLALAPACVVGVEHEDPFERLERGEPSPDVVVAKVGSTELGRADLEAYWRQHPELSREAALEGLVTEVLLAQEGVSRGLRDRALVDGRKRGLTRALLRRAIEDEVTTPDAAVVERAKAEIESKETNPAGLVASHLLVGGEAFEANRGLARELLEEARGRLGKQPGPVELQALAGALSASGRLPEGLIAHSDVRMTFPRKAVQGPLPRGWVTLVPEFTAASNEAADAGNLGVLFGPVETSFGLHLIVVHEAIEPEGIENLDARAQARALDVARSEATDALMTSLRETHEWDAYPDRLLEDAAGE